MIGRSCERGSGISVLAARYDDDDYYLYKNDDDDDYLNKKHEVLNSSG